ncbi:MAG: UvrY/SirA/GacA family response regulator transcription factor [Pseudomonadota bacterium]
MIRVLIVDDHRLFRAGLVRMLSEVSTVKLVGEADCGEEAVQLCRDLRPNVVLMDLFMPGIGGIEACRRIVAQKLDIKVLMVSGCIENPFPSQALRAGAVGYVSKSILIDELVTAIKKAFVGKRYLSREVAHQLALNSFNEHADSPFEQLSGREMQIMLMVVNCHKVTEISSNLHLSPKTVNSYRYRIFEKLNVSSDVELALMAVRHGMIAPEARAR